MKRALSGKEATRAIKERLNLADVARRYITLTRAGGRWVAPCPFHQETKPSFSINEEEGFFYCFGCQASGDLFDFYARINGLEFREALEQLAEEAGIPLDAGKQDGSGASKDSGSAKLRQDARKMHELAAAYYGRTLAGPEGEACRAYLEKRQISPEIVETFGLGWSPREWRGLADTLRRSGFEPRRGVEAGLLTASERGAPYDRFRGRLMFPIKSLSGQVIAFGGRIIADEDAAKYINSADSPLYKKGDHLYGLFQARRSIAAASSVMLTEGYMDVLTLHQFGFSNACGVLGTALTAEQVRRLAGFCSDFELLFDGDDPGRKAALRACEMIITKGLRCKVVLFPQGEDIDSLLHGSGPQAFESLRHEAPEGLDFCIRYLAGKAPRDALEWVKNFLKQLHAAQPELLTGYASRLARGLGMDEAELVRGLRGSSGGTAESRGAAGIPWESAPVGAVHQGNSPEYGAGTPRERSRRGDFTGRRAAERFGQSGRAGFGRGSLSFTGPRPEVPSVEVHLLNFLVRYPHHLPLLRDQGAELVLLDPWNRGLWAKVAAAAPEFDVDEVFSSLDDKEREFWIQQRMLHAGLPKENEDLELADVCERIQKVCHDRQGKSCISALRRTSSGATYDADLMRALLETMRRKHG